jgi:hypothetical protein
VMASGSRTNRAIRSLDVVPSLCAIEFSNLNSVDLLPFKIARIDADLCAGSRIDWLPMCRAATNLAMHRSDRAWSPDVLSRILRMPVDLDGVGFV